MLSGSLGHMERPLVGVLVPDDHGIDPSHVSEGTFQMTLAPDST